MINKKQIDVNKIRPNIEVIQAMERIKVRRKRTAEDILAIGHDLILIKSNLKHGQFLPWIEHYFDMSRSSANAFMQAANRFGINLSLSCVSPTIIYELAKPSMPDEVVKEVTLRIESGETIKVKDIKELKKKIRSKIS